MEHGLLIVAIILQVGLGSYILMRNPRSRVNQLFAWCSLFYTLSSFAGLLRSLPVDRVVAANLLVFSTIVVYVWTATFIGISTLAVFYPEQSKKHRFWALYLPVGLAVLATVGILVFYASLPDKGSAVELVAGSNIYDTKVEVFSARYWGVGYITVWTLLSVALLVNVAIRRSGSERYSALLLGILVLLPAVVGSFGSQWLPGSSKITVPTLSSALFSVAFAYVIIRYRLFSAEEVAVRLVLDNLRDGMLVLRADRVVSNCNTCAAELMGLPRQAVINKRIDDVLVKSALPEAVWRDIWSEMQQGRGLTREVQYTVEQTERAIVNELMPVYDAQKNVQGYVWMIRDVTELRQNEEQIQARNRELQAAIAELQSTSEVQSRLLNTVRSLSVPAVPILQGIIVMPISGQIDSERARRILDGLLAGIGDYQAKIAIIDITGVPVVDTAVAQYLIQAARAASLMGCRPLLVGIRPEIAQVIVELGIDMSGLVTFSDLQSGVEYALRVLGIELVHIAAARGRVAAGYKR